MASWLRYLRAARSCAARRLSVSAASHRHNSNETTDRFPPQKQPSAVTLVYRLVDFRKPLSITLDGKSSEVKIAPSLATLCRTMAERGDPHLAGSCVVPLT